MLAKRTYKNQITIPKKIIKRFGDVEYFDVEEEEGRIVLRPVEIDKGKSKLSIVRKKLKMLGLTEKDINEAIQWARKESQKSE